MEKMIKIPVERFQQIKRIESTIDLDLLDQFVNSLNDINNGKIRRVK